MIEDKSLTNDEAVVIDPRTAYKVPDLAVITTTNYKDEHVQMLIQHYRFKKLNFRVDVVEKTDDGNIDIKLYLGEELLDNMGVPHKG